MRIGMVCPYSFDVPGGVQSHVLQLADVMHARAHDVSVLAPSSPHVELPDYVVSGAGCLKATSTCCTSTSPTHPACRCWR
jgi:hypothetical protein